VEEFKEQDGGRYHIAREKGSARSAGKFNGPNSGELHFRCREGTAREGARGVFAADPKNRAEAVVAHQKRDGLETGERRDGKKKNRETPRKRGGG